MYTTNYIYTSYKTNLFGYVFKQKDPSLLKWDRSSQNSKNLLGGVSNAFAILNKVVNEIGLYVLDSIDPI